MKKTITICIGLLITAMTLAACLSPSTVTASTPTPPVLADSFFSGQAWLDVNANGQVDAEDTPLANATLIVSLQDGTEFGAKTDADGKAFVSIPARVDYPITLRMEAPEGSMLKPVEPSRVTLKEAAGETVLFLFEQGRWRSSSTPEKKRTTLTPEAREQALRQK